MRLLRIMGSRARRLFPTGTDSGDFWVITLRDICATLQSVQKHGGFHDLCRRWRQNTKRECLVALNELIAILNEWKNELEREVPAPQQPRTAEAAIATPGGAIGARF